MKVSKFGIMKGYTKMNYEKTVIPPLNKAKMREMKEYMDNLATAVCPFSMLTA